MKIKNYILTLILCASYLNGVQVLAAPPIDELINQGMQSLQNKAANLDPSTRQINKLKGNLRKKSEQRFIRKQKLGGATIVHGFVKSRGNVRGTNKATGAQLDIDAKPGESVHGNVTLIHHGNVTATGRQNATASGAEVNLNGARAGSLNIKSRVYGNISANAAGSGKVTAKASGLSVRGAKNTIMRQNIDHHGRGDITASGTAR
ncbi:hypothetical protein [Candidatus Venteria ishoeyi]|uniref:Auto-transporter adhesin head GIN domain-containing protein n=1 Tax=Candidatus Venteria ishoeyi TaxID=1899563 RepID=A0A1H6F687_9GAMM|nr:hypothetical protein [Candidatus Venteria ishoeyi]SEH04891.1 Uncharacterised protein [Candidatus Venteria ishoeyi]